MANIRFDFEDLYTNYLDYLHINKKSINTIKNYKVTYIQLENFISTGKRKISTQQFEKYIFNFLKELSSKYHSTTTLQAKRIHLRRLITFGYRNGYVEQNFSGKIESLKTDKGKQKKVLKPEEIKKIQVVLNEDIEKATGFQKFLKVRNRFLFFTFLWTGARISEVANLKWADIDLGKTEITFLGKGNKTRSVPISNEYLLQIFRYKETMSMLKEMGFISTQNYTYVFHSVKNRGEDTPITTKGITEILKDIFKRSDISQDITPHSLRHTFASYGIMNNVSLTGLAAMLGHTSTKVTADVYAHVISRQQMHQEMSRIKFNIDVK